jgi:hypothetical protein
MFSTELAAVLALLNVELSYSFASTVIVFLGLDCVPLVDTEKAS